MAGGPITPISIYLGGAAGNLFPNFYGGNGGNASAFEEGVGVIASLSTPATCQLRFPMPPSIPSGTMKLMCRHVANASTGTIAFTVSDAIVASGASPSAATLTSETTQSVAWGATDADKYKDAKVSLSATPTTDSSLVVAVQFTTAGYTMAQTVTAQYWVLWE